MRFGINTLDDFELYGKTVLCRIDINQPIDRATGKLKSTVRIEACTPTIKELSEKGAKVVLLAHQGSDIEYENYWTLEPHASVLSKYLEKPVRFVPDIYGPTALGYIAALRPGEILLLDNVRFLSEEQTLFEKKLRLTHDEQAETLLVRKLAPLGDLYVCDAFAAAHRDQPSLCGFEKKLPSAMGRLFEKEYCILSELIESPKRPCTFVLGGAKIADAFMMMETVLKSGVADKILPGGLAGNIMLIAAGKNIGQGSYDFIAKKNYLEFIEKAKGILSAYGDRVVLPVDVAYVSNGSRVDAMVGELPADACALDIGEKTAEVFSDIIMNSETVFVNGPMGVYEDPVTELGTKAVWDAISDTSAFTVLGGGDSITATEKYNKSESISYICTGGGALVRFLAGEELPAVTALRGAAK